MRKACVCGMIIFVLFVSSALTLPHNYSAAVKHTLDYFRSESEVFAERTAALKEAISAIDSNYESIIKAREALIDCRLQYKKIAFLLAYFFNSTALVYNAPAKYEVEEPYMEYDEPHGLQYIEELLYSDKVKESKNELMQQAELINSTTKDLNALLYDFNGNDKQVLESINLELIRVMSLSIAGYDAVYLKTGIKEAYQELSAIQYCLKPFTNSKSGEASQVNYYLDKSLKYLKENEDFDSFNRLNFLIEAALPLQHHLNLLINELGLNINTTGVLNYNAPLYSVAAINANAFTQTVSSAAIVALGKKLFTEPALSGNNKRSCISCHQPQKYFTDNKVKSPAFDGRSSVDRNTPTLLYAGFQYVQRWDGSVKSIEDQVKQVIASPVEMNADFAVIVKKLQANEDYNSYFKKAFRSEKGNAVSINNVAISIAAYIRTLSPGNAPFDRYMQGDKTALTKAQINGFNLFMGKAQCGTCHFAPLFNGLVPPFYNRTETEVLGVPNTDDFTHMELDADEGRFKTYPIKFYRGAFKTPTLRNVAATAPYMHNGAFHSLEKVVDFYNKGGGRGLGLKVEAQTLSAKPLNLTNDEVSDIISFLNSLTDSVREAKN